MFELFLNEPLAFYSFYTFNTAFYKDFTIYYDLFANFYILFSYY